MGLYFNIALFLPLNKYEGKEVKIIGYVLEKNISNSNRFEYIVCTKNFDKYKCIKDIKFKMYSESDFEIGDKIYFKGSYTEGEGRRNYKGFNYKNYLKGKQIYGIFNVNDTEYIKKIGNENNFNVLISKIKLKFNSILRNIYDEKIYGFMQSLLLGNKLNLNKDIKELFQETSISHVLAISGMHVGIILVWIDNLLEKVVKNKRGKYIFEIIFLCFFYIITGMQVSCFRSVLFNVLSIVNILKYDKNDISKNVITTYLLLILMNIYNVINIGLYLSFLSSISIMVFNNFFSKFFRKLKIFKTEIVVSLSAQFLILPIMIYSFNFFSFNFIITNILVSLCIGIILKIGYVTLILGFFCSYSKMFFVFKIFEVINYLLVKCVTVVLEILFKILELISKIKILNINFRTPSFISVLLWYVIICFIIYNFRKNKFKYYKFIKSRGRRKKVVERKNIIKFYNKVDKVNNFFISFIIILIFILITNTICVNLSQNGFIIYFIDVGQGDCTLIKTNRNKTILIDSGEGTSSKSDKGKNVIYPYLLDRGIKQIDYLILSHFDSDHAGGSIYLLENLDVKNVIIGIQNEDSYLYRKIIELVNENNINLIVIDNPQILKIDDVYFDFIWPIKDKLIHENKLNNNSLVFRVIYKDIKIMFTGDIEIPAEKEIVNVYKNTGKSNKNRLSSDILKLAHHGSDTSTTIEYLELVNPKIALIGVGKNNSFNHPSEDVIERLLEKKIKIYRTDLDRRNNYKIHKW